MTQNVATRLDAQKRKADIPEEIFRQMRTCQTAAERVSAPILLAQKTAKATGTAGYLTKTPEKVAAIVRAAEMAGVDRTRVQTDERIPIRGRTDINGHRSTQTIGNEKKAAPGAQRA
ncbi:hypothetical protein EDB85DRAFT_1962810 [Lactarius pseudohatsudake]|nr:hypothetical protein EDB85DRAFT_1962810 [Lactarius pseudohatsudake]